MELSIKYLLENDIDIKEIENELLKFSLEGKTPILVANKKKLIGVYVLSDSVKVDSKEAIENIKSLGIIPIMLTGDNELSAKYVASLVGIDYVISEVLPEGKLEIINRLKEYGKVMMVGDGINDAIALTSASIGVAIGRIYSGLLYIISS